MFTFLKKKKLGEVCSNTPTMDTSSDFNDDVNSHVRQYLKHYLSDNRNLRFGVLINGKWGVGKSHFVREFLESENIKNTVYISLYGLSSTEDINSLILYAQYPMLGWKPVQVVSGVAGSSLGILGAHKPDISADKFLRIKSDNIYIFDDLERCCMPMNMALGFINEFVEGHGCKVIVIANEDGINESQINSYRSEKEKVIGKTLSINPSVQSALNYFITQLNSTKAKEFIKCNYHDVINIYTLSEHNNLRILQQSLWDFERLFDAIDDIYISNTRSMVDLLRYFLAISIEIKKGTIISKDITNRATDMLNYHAFKKEGDEAIGINKITHKYPLVNFYTPVISDEIILACLVDGLVITSNVNAALSGSQYFLSIGKEEESWFTLWHYSERSENEFYIALEKFNSSFENFEFVTDGVLPHIFGIKLFLSKSGVVEEPLELVVQECIEYLDKLFEMKKISPRKAGFEHESSYAGLGYLEADLPEFKTIIEHFNKLREQAKEVFSEYELKCLLSDMVSNIDEFVKKITGPEYSYLPILAFTDYKTFVNNMLSLHPYQQGLVFKSLLSRYKNNQLDYNLPQEKCWLKKIVEEILVQADTQSAITAYRLKRQVSWYLADFAK